MPVARNGGKSLDEETRVCLWGVHKSGDISEKGVEVYFEIFPKNFFPMHLRNNKIVGQANPKAKKMADSERNADSDERRPPTNPPAVGQLVAKQEKLSRYAVANQVDEKTEMENEELKDQIKQLQLEKQCLNMDQVAMQREVEKLRERIQLLELEKSGSAQAQAVQQSEIERLKEQNQLLLQEKSCSELAQVSQQTEIERLQRQNNVLQQEREGAFQSDAELAQMRLEFKEMKIQFTQLQQDNAKYQAQHKAEMAKARAATEEAQQLTNLALKDRINSFISKETNTANYYPRQIMNEDGSNMADFIFLFEQNCRDEHLPMETWGTNIRHHLTGNARTFYISLLRNNRINLQEWDTVKKQLLRHFSWGNSHSSVMAKLSNNIWRGDHRLYIRDFFQAVAGAEGITESELVDHFLWKLPFDLQRSVTGNFTVEFSSWSDAAEALYAVMEPYCARQLANRRCMLLEEAAKQGEIAKQTRPAIVGMQKSPPAIRCTTCQGLGHNEKECPLARPGYCPKQGQTCQRCGGKEHFATDCPTRAIRSNYGGPPASRSNVSTATSASHPNDKA